MSSLEKITNMLEKPLNNINKNKDYFLEINQWNFKIYLLRKCNNYSFDNSMAIIGELNIIDGVFQSKTLFEHANHVMKKFCKKHKPELALNYPDILKIKKNKDELYKQDELYKRYGRYK